MLDVLLQKVEPFSPPVYDVQSQPNKRLKLSGKQYLTAAESEDFFRDTPWPAVSLDNIESTVPLTLPQNQRHRLLGGSSKDVSNGKPSKLAALAAARKKERESKKIATESSSSKEVEHSSKTTLSTPLEQKTAIGSTGSSRQDDESLGDRTLSALASLYKASTERKYPSRALPKEDSLTTEPEQRPPSTNGSAWVAVKSADMRTTPSAFAQAILGTSTRQNIHEDHERRRSSTIAQAQIPAGRVAEDSLFSLPLFFNRAGLKAARVNNDSFAGPSPDDIVAKAQSQVKGAPKTNGASSKAESNSASTNGVANGVAAMKLNDTSSASTPKANRKTVDVVGEFNKTASKQAANFVVIGHVDHGKSTLMGRLLYDLKIINQRSVDKLQKEANSTGKSSFALAWVMDSTPEERARGVTVDIATNHFETEKTRFTILDAPGHRDFIPNMIAGAAQADFAVLVIDASTNAYEAGLKGQTKEHALLARSIGIARVIVAINKMDAANWSQDRFEEIRQQMKAFLLSAGFQSKNLTFVPCAGITGINVASKPNSEPNPMPWYENGPCLVDALDACEPATRSLSDPLRMTISDIFRGGVTNPVSISGRIDTGHLQVGDTILTMPAGEKAYIKGVEVDGKVIEWAVAGQIPTLHLSDIDPVHLRSGDIVCDPQRSPIQNVKQFTAKILAFEHLLPGAFDVHRGRLHTSARLTSLLAILGKSEGEVLRKKPKVVKPGQVARVQLELESALPLEPAARIVVRSEGATIGAGLVEETSRST